MKQYEEGVRDLLRRLTATISERADAILSRFEDPREALNYAYELELEELVRARQAVERVPAVLHHLDLLAGRLSEEAAALETQAREAVNAGLDDQVAREALARRRVLLAGASSLQANRGQLANEEALFASAVQRLEAKVATLGAAKEALTITLGHSEGASEQLDKLTAEIRDERASVKEAVERCHRAVAEVDVRANAIDRLLASGAISALDRPLTGLEADVERARGSIEVAQDLASLKSRR